MQIKQSAVGVLADLCYSNCKEIVVMPVQGSRSLHKWYWFLAGFGNGTTYPQKFWWTINNWTGCNATYIRVLKITIGYWSFHWSTLEQRIQLNAQKLVKSVTTDQMWFCSMPLDCPREVCLEHLSISLCCLHIKCDNYAFPHLEGGANCSAHVGRLVCMLLFLIQLITRERFAPEASNLVGR